MKTSASANARHTVQFGEKSLFNVLIMPKLSEEQRIRLVRLYYANNSSPEELSVESINLNRINSQLAESFRLMCHTEKFGAWSLDRCDPIQSLDVQIQKFSNKPNKIAMSHLVHLSNFR